MEKRWTANVSVNVSVCEEERAYGALGAQTIKLNHTSMYNVHICNMMEYRMKICAPKRMGVLHLMFGYIFKIEFALVQNYFHLCFTSSIRED